MSGHLTDGELRAGLDGELDQAAALHLTSCSACQARLRPIRRQAEEIGQYLDLFRDLPNAAAPSVRSSLARLQQMTSKKKEISMFNRLFRSRLAQAVLVAVLLLAVTIAVPGTRALADHLLNLFRIEQVTVLPVDLSGLQSLNGNSALGKQISQLISDSTTVVKEPGNAVEVSSAADASQKAGFAVRLPSGAAFSRLSVRQGAAFNFTIDRARAQGLLAEAGRTDLTLPEDVDGAMVAVNIPASVRADYGTCPEPSAAPDSQLGTPGRNYPDCIILFELPSPSVNAPANVNVAQLAQIGLEFTGMTSEQAAAFTNSVDWTSTLVVPIPKNAATYQQLTVDGVTGTLIQRPADDAPQFLLMWVKNGIVYAIGGLGADSQRAIDMANSLP